MIKNIKIPKVILILCCLLTSILSVNKLDALTYNSYLRLNGSDTNLSTGYTASVAANSQLTFVSYYYLEDTGGLDYYLTTTLKVCSTGYLTAYNDEDAFLVSTSVKNIGTCKVKTYTGTLYEIKWVRYLPVVNGSNVATANVYVKTSKYSYASFHQFVSTDLTVQTAQVYEQQQSLERQDKTNQKLDDLTDKITDTTAPDTSGFGNVSGWLPAGPVDSILTLPIKVLNTISGVLSGTCSPISLPLPFIDSNLELPCGDTFYDGVTGLSVFLNTLGLIVGGYLLYCYLIYLYNWVDKKVSMVENDREKWGVV